MLVVSHLADSSGQFFGQLDLGSYHHCTSLPVVGFYIMITLHAAYDTTRQMGAKARA